MAFARARHGKPSVEGETSGLRRSAYRDGGGPTIRRPSHPPQNRPTVTTPTTAAPPATTTAIPSRTTIVTHCSSNEAMAQASSRSMASARLSQRELSLRLSMGLPTGPAAGGGPHDRALTIHARAARGASIGSSRLPHSSTDERRIAFSTDITTGLSSSLSSRLPHSASEDRHLGGGSLRPAGRSNSAELRSTSQPLTLLRSSSARPQPELLLTQVGSDVHEASSSSVKTHLTPSGSKPRLASKSPRVVTLGVSPRDAPHGQQQHEPKRKNSSTTPRTPSAVAGPSSSSTSPTERKPTDHVRAEPGARSSSNALSSVEGAPASTAAPANAAHVGVERTASQPDAPPQTGGHKGQEAATATTSITTSTTSAGGPSSSSSASSASASVQSSTDNLSSPPQAMGLSSRFSSSSSPISRTLASAFDASSPDMHLSLNNGALPHPSFMMGPSSMDGLGSAASVNNSGMPPFAELLSAAGGDRHRSSLDSGSQQQSSYQRPNFPAVPHPLRGNGGGGGGGGDRSISGQQSVSYPMMRRVAEARRDSPSTAPASMMPSFRFANTAMSPSAFSVDATFGRQGSSSGPATNGSSTTGSTTPRTASSTPASRPMDSSSHPHHHIPGRHHHRPSALALHSPFRKAAAFSPFHYSIPGSLASSLNLSPRPWQDRCLFYESLAFRLVSQLAMATTDLFSREQFIQFALGEGLSEERAMAMFAVVNKRGDGTVDFKEYLQLLCAVLAPRHIKHTHLRFAEFALAASKEGLAESELKRAFDLADNDADEKVDFASCIRAAVSVVNERKLTPRAISEANFIAWCSSQASSPGCLTPSQANHLLAAASTAGSGTGVTRVGRYAQSIMSVRDSEVSSQSSEGKRHSILRPGYTDVVEQGQFDFPTTSLAAKGRTDSGGALTRGSIDSLNSSFTSHPGEDFHQQPQLQQEDLATLEAMDSKKLAAMLMEERAQLAQAKADITQAALIGRNLLDTVKAHEEELSERGRIIADLRREMAQDRSAVKEMKRQATYYKTLTLRLVSGQHLQPGETEIPPGSPTEEENDTLSKLASISRLTRTLSSGAGSGAGGGGSMLLLEEDWLDALRGLEEIGEEEFVTKCTQEGLSADQAKELFTAADTDKNGMVSWEACWRVLLGELFMRRQPFLEAICGAGLTGPQIESIVDRLPTEHGTTVVDARDLVGALYHLHAELCEAQSALSIENEVLREELELERAVLRGEKEMTELAAEKSRSQIETMAAEMAARVSTLEESVCKLNDELSERDKKIAQLQARERDLENVIRKLRAQVEEQQQQLQQQQQDPKRASTPPPSSSSTSSTSTGTNTTGPTAPPPTTLPPQPENAAESEWLKSANSRLWMEVARMAYDQAEKDRLLRVANAETTFARNEAMSVWDQLKRRVAELGHMHNDRHFRLEVAMDIQGFLKTLNWTAGHVYLTSEDLLDLVWAMVAAGLPVTNALKLIERAINCEHVNPLTCASCRLKQQFVATQMQQSQLLGQKFDDVYFYYYRYYVNVPTWMPFSTPAIGAATNPAVPPSILGIPQLGAPMLGMGPGVPPPPPPPPSLFPAFAAAAAAAHHHAPHSHGMPPQPSAAAAAAPTAAAAAAAAAATTAASVSPPGSVTRLQFYSQ